MLTTKLDVQTATLPDLAPDWNALLDRSAIRTVFVRPIWHQVWLRSFQEGRELALHGVRDGDRLLGVAPFLADDSHLLFSGDPNNCDYMDFVLDAGAEESALRALFDAVAAGPWQEVRLWGVQESSPTRRLLPGIAEACGYSLTWEEEAVCPRLELPSTWDAYLAQLKKKDRHELRRKMRRFFEHGSEVNYYALTSPDEIAAAMDEFLHLMESSKHEKAEFLTPQMEHFFREMAVTLAGEGLIRLYFLELDGVRVAAVLCFDCDNELLMYNSGYDPQLSHLAVGLISKALLVKDAIEQGRKRLDFLRGDERYKYDLGAQNSQVYKCTVTRR